MPPRETANQNRPTASNVGRRSSHRLGHDQHCALSALGHSPTLPKGRPKLKLLFEFVLPDRYLLSQSDALERRVRGSHRHGYTARCMSDSSAAATVDSAGIRQTPPLPERPRPIVSIGAGAIVRDAHAPAYRTAGFPIASVFDVVPERAEELARSFQIPRVCRSLGESIETAPTGAVFDLALPASAVLDVLAALPDGAPVLIQKPMGENLAEARRILALCRKKRLVAAVNFQLRFAPGIVAARDLLERGVLGELHDVEVRVTCHMPWERWTFLFGIPRMEIVYHSIHYVDLVRSFFGEPSGVFCKTVKHPHQMELASTRTAIAFDYGEVRRATITTNHGHAFGTRHQESYVKLEGTGGAVKIRLGMNIDYPRGLPDELEYCHAVAGLAPAWTAIPLRGNWLPHAFVGTMANLMRYADGETDELATSVEDAVRTMAVVEGCYASSEQGATPIPEP
jgi:predicted dehydrogenase